MNRRLKLIGFAALVAGFCFGKSFSLMAQEEEPPPMYINIGFYKVDQENRAAYEMLMKDVFGPIMQKRVDEGCLNNWIFRRVLPNSSLFGEFTHMTLDVMLPGEEGYWNCEANLEEVFPGLSPEVREYLYQEKNSLRTLVQRVRTSYVAGYTSLTQAPPIAVFNLSKTKSDQYEAKHRDGFADFFAEGSNTVACHAMKRIDSTAWAKWEWDYLTVDCYETPAKMREPVRFPAEKSRYYQENYGPASDQRDILMRAETRLLFATEKKEAPQN